MKRILILLFLCFQTLFASIQEYKLGNARVIICDDFFLPIAKVGVFYYVGLNQLKNICEAEIIDKIFLSKTAKKSAKKLGTDVDFCIHDNFSEVSTIVSNEQISDIIKIILNNKTDVIDLPLIKDKIKLEYKLSDYFETDFFDNEIYARINSKHVFNESILDNITENDLKNSLDKYEKAHVDIIICGKFDTKKLVEKLHLEPLSPGDSESVNTNQDEITPQTFTKQIVEAKSKFLGRSLHYMYKISFPELREKQNAISSILSYEMFSYFKKHSQLVNNFFITNFAKPDFILLGFTPKRDVSKKSFEISLKSFFSYLKKINFSPEKLESISKLQKFSEINIDEDISAKYQIIKDRYITHSQSKNDTSKEILTVSSDDIRNFIEQVIENNLITKISTQYKMEN